jgi:DNA mismatch repair protein MutS
MAGKSVALRQVGLIVLLAQVGSFVPAEKARIGIVDRIFTRVGASDNLAAGESTFLVEMNETASILHNATPRSLILLDEVGRGTSTFDGLSIAWALVEYLHERADVAARTLFATHYHELNELADRYSRIRNFRVQVQEHGDKVVFLRRLVPGGADHSYGIEVARMAGLPDELIGRAREVLRHLEAQQLAEAVGQASGAKSPVSMPDAVRDGAFQMSLFAAAEPDPLTEAIREKLRTVDPDRMTPIEALLLVSSLRRLADDHGE